MIKLILAVAVIMTGGEKLYTKIFDSKINLNDSFINELRIGVEGIEVKTSEEKMNCFKMNDIYVIYQISRKRDYGRPLLTILSQSNDPLSLLRAGYIIYYLKKELMKKDGFAHYISTVINGENYRVLTIDVQVDSIINMTYQELNELEKEKYVSKLQVMLNNLFKKIPPEKVALDSRIYLFDNKHPMVDPSIAEDECKSIFNSTKNHIIKSYGKDFMKKIVK